MRLAPLLLFAATLSHAAPPPDFPTDEAAAESLGDPDFLRRERAARHLWRSGKPALPLLEKLAVGKAETSLRALTIAQNIRLGITPETTGDLAGLIRRIDAKPDDNLPIINTLSEPGGNHLVLSYIQNRAKIQPENWEANLARAARILFEKVGDQSPIYEDLLAAIPDPARRATFYPTLGRGGYAFAYDLLTYDPDPSKRPPPDRRNRVVEKFRELDTSPEARHLRPQLLSLLGKAERLEGAPSIVPGLVEPFLSGTGDALHAFAMTGIAYETDHLGQWIVHHAERPANAPALVAAVIHLQKLPVWIEKYRTRIRSEPTHLNHLTLAQFHRAHGNHAEALRIAKSHTAHPTHEATFALLADDLDRVRQLAPEIVSELADNRFADLKKRIPKFLDHIENPDADPGFLRFPSPHFHLTTKNYRAFAAAADPSLRLTCAAKLAPVSPALARKLTSAIAMRSWERRRGQFGQYLEVKRLLREEGKAIDYISTRFGTITSDFWEHFLEKHFAKSPLWIMLHLRRRNPEMPRADLFRNALVKGTAALVPADLDYKFALVKESLESTGRIPPDTYDNLATLYQDPRFSKVVEKIRRWDSALPDGDRRKGMIDPDNERFAPDPDTATCIRNRWFRLAKNLEEAEIAARSELLPSPAALLPVGKNHLANGEIDEAVRWLTLAGWQALVSQFWKSGEDDHYQTVDGMALYLDVHQTLESALGLQSLQNGDFPSARKRFENLCAIGSMDHQLGATLFHHLVESGNQSEADALFSTRWNQLEAILEIAPRDAEVCRAISAWSKACGNRRASEAEVFADLAESLEREQAEFKTYLTRFDW